MNEVTSEAPDRLIFNGLKPDGSYALAPKTAQQLVERIRSTSEREEELAKRLDQALKSAEKVRDIAGFLVEENLKMLDGNISTREVWIAALARQLLVKLLGEDLAGEGLVQKLARYLEQDTRRKVDKIILELLKPGGGQSQELKALLLPQKTEDALSLKDTLKYRTARWGGTIRDTLLNAEKARDLAGNPGSRVVWLDNLSRQLKALPIESLKAITENRSIVAEPLKRLVSTLRVLPGSDADWLVKLVQDLEPLSTKGRYASWPTVVDILAHNLHAVTTGETHHIDWELLLGALTTWINSLLLLVSYLGTVPWVDPTKLDEAGWGVIFPVEMEDDRQEAIEAALAPLLAWRKGQAKALYRVFKGREGYRPGDNARTFLGRLGADPSQPADPGKTGVPYYLLMVGNPEEIPFEFQYGPDVQYAVGRIDFDCIEDYAAYARSVVAAEQTDFALAPAAVFVAVENPGDEATRLSAQHLVKPVSEHLRARVDAEASKGIFPAWDIAVVPPQAARLAQVLDIVRRDTAPALLFTASHGMEFTSGDPRQLLHQGALVCADWQGPGHPVLPEHYLSGDVLAMQDDANLLGTIVFMFACYGAGTPQTDDYYRQDFADKGEMIAEQPFIAALPKAMLSLAKGGALAVVGHVERVWSLSYLGPERRRGLDEPRRDEHLGIFNSMLELVMRGHPVGEAMDYFGVRYAALSTELTAALDAFTPPDDYQLAELWTANHDARGYVIIGDPAVRLRVAPTAAEATPRPDLD